jgi:hypothetical protein
MNEQAGAGPGSRGPDRVDERVLPLSRHILQWRADGHWRQLTSRDDEADVDWQPWTGADDWIVQADGEVWDTPSWLVAWGELPAAGVTVTVLRTDDTPVPVEIVGNVWACEWVGHGEPVTIQFDDGFPVTTRIRRPDFL